MALFKLNIEPGWFKVASVFALLIFIFCKKATSLFKNNKPAMLTSDEQKQVLVVTESILRVINSYINFILIISDSIDASFSQGEEAEAERKNKVRKFSTVKKELHKFLNTYKEICTLKKITVESNDGSVLYERDVNIDYENFLSQDNALEIFKLLNVDTLLYSEMHYSDKKVLEILKNKIGKSTMTIEDAQQFVENDYLFDNKNFGIKKSNYTDLNAYIKQRTVDYCHSKVSTENINGMSFSYKRLTDVETCPICLEDYEKDQEVCRLPCNHFCCRVCTERVFSTRHPEKYGYVVSCPICRINCA